MGFLIFILLLLSVAVSVSFYTLFERKVMGSSHSRIGPAIVSVWGILQPFSDAVKLFTKEQSSLMKSNYYVYVLSPSVNLMISFVLWCTLPLYSGFLNIKYSILVLIVVMSISVYSFLGISWSSNSNYAMVGALRCVAQTISYEVSLVFIILCLLFLSDSFHLLPFSDHQEDVYFICLIMPLFISWWLSCLAETNRSPFDFAEAESELVSGFNVEYSAGGFALMFISEYSAMIFFSMLTVVLFMGGNTTTMLTFLLVVGLMYLFVWVRVSYPRTRYDKLMGVAWTIILPSTLVAILYLSYDKFLLWLNSLN